MYIVKKYIYISAGIYLLSLPTHSLSIIFFTMSLNFLSLSILFFTTSPDFLSAFSLFSIKKKYNYFPGTIYHTRGPNDTVTNFFFIKFYKFLVINSITFSSFFF
ncbi:hypothetical protein WN943_027956 [Citrus x changshan-huyou]